MVERLVGRVGERVDERVGERVGERVDERVDERVGERVNERVGERVDERVGERVGERVDGRVGERVGEPNFIENRSLTVIGLASVISNCNRFSFTVASVTLEKEPTVLQRKELRFSQKGSKSVGRSNCVANYRTSVMIRVSVMNNTLNALDASRNCPTLPPLLF